MNMQVHFAGNMIERMDFLARALALTTASLNTGTGTGDTQGPTATETPSSKNSSAFASTLSSSSSSLHTLSHLSYNSSSASSTIPATNATQSFTSHAANITSPPFFSLNSNNTFNNTRAPDLNNATECWSYFWSYSEANWGWFFSHQKTYTITTSVYWTIRSDYPPLPTATGNASLVGNYSWTSYCDGMPRFTDAVAASNYTMTELATPIVTTRTYEDLSYLNPTEPNPYPESNLPSCTINGASECTNMWSMFATSLSKSITSWESKNVFTISVASPPTAVVVNGKSTPLITTVPGQLPPLPIKSSTYAPRNDHAGSAWYIDDAYNFIGETTVVPGKEVTLTFNVQETLKDFGPTGPDGCARPSPSIDAECSKTKLCTIKGEHVELIYFPPPTSSRNLCANTNSLYNRYSQSIYKHPHQSAVVNGTTFWADKAYVRYNTVSAYKWCEYGFGLGLTRVPLRNTYTSTYVEVESSDLATICGIQYNPIRPYGKVIAATPVPMNFADLQAPVPMSAYMCQPLCYPGCDYIVEDNYNPNLAVPPQVRGLDPEWADCVPYFEGTPDPPIALTAIPDFLTSVTTAPQPGITPTQPAKPTRPVDPPVDLTQPVDPPTDSPASTTNQIRPPQDPSNNDPSQTSQGVPDGTFDPPVSFTLTLRPGGGSGSGGGAPSQTTLSLRPLPPQATGTGPNQDQETGGAQGLQPGTTTPINGIPITVQPDGSIVVTIPSNDPGGNSAPQILRPGQAQISVNGHTIFMSSSGDAVVVDGQVHTIISPQSLNNVNLLITMNPDGSVSVTINGVMQTLQSGGPPVMVIGRTISLSSTGEVIIDGQSFPLYFSSSSSSSTSTLQTLPMTLNPDGSISVTVNVVSQKLQPGGPQITVNGHTISLNTNGDMVVDGKVYTLTRSTDSSGNFVVITGPDGPKMTISVAPAKATTAAEKAVSSSGSRDLEALGTGSSPSPSSISSYSTTDGESGTTGTSGSPSTSPSQTGKKNGVARINPRGGNSWILFNLFPIIVTVILQDIVL
ncbi:hypothetical protein DE146DRAFT_731524 [Phaeosphaeria sp. MPI-PUGE-AT-0046c]|nr:hypothetical protein DE146DRAFT_731524 [Phaeosphaeria sp. MPI-PUGE-AT-0046c]